MDVSQKSVPLAERMRPRIIEDVVGQSHLVGTGKGDGLLVELLNSGKIPSLILWGPPGCGKTTIARLLAERVQAQFVQLSAVSSGVKDLREVVAQAEQSSKMFNQHTVLFIDEIHRYNRTQQDALLPYVESGVITLIGATTENPSFEVVSPLLSRCRTLVLQPLSEDELLDLLSRTVRDEVRGLYRLPLLWDTDDLRALARSADGDARFALGTLEIAAQLAFADLKTTLNPLEKPSHRTKVSKEIIQKAAQQKMLSYDKDREQHFDIISALHKSVRGSDPDAALYWLVRMLEGGEDPLYLARRLARMAIEDIGLADPEAIKLAMAVKDTVHFIGRPECDLALAELAIYLAAAPKSNSAYVALDRTRKLIKETGTLPVPLHIRNAPTKLMADIGYGKNYKYAHEFEDAFAPDQYYLPDALRARNITLYIPEKRGYEELLAARLVKWWKNRYKPDNAE